MAVLPCDHRSVCASIGADMAKLPLGFQKTPYFSQTAPLTVSASVRCQCSASINQADHNPHHDPLRCVHDALQHGEPPADVEHHVVVEHEAAELEDGEKDAEPDAFFNAGTRGVHAREDCGSGGYREEYAEHANRHDGVGRVAGTVDRRVVRELRAHGWDEEEDAADDEIRDERCESRDGNPGGVHGAPGVSARAGQVLLADRPPQPVCLATPRPCRTDSAFKTP